MSLSEEEIPEQPVAPARAPARPFVHRVFVGHEGLRAGWSALLYLLITGLLLIVAFAGLRFLFPGIIGKPGSGFSPLRVGVAEGVQVAAALAGTWVMALIERRRWTSYGFDDAHLLPRFGTGAFWGFFLISLLVLALWLSGHMQITGSLLSLGDDLRYGLLWFVVMLLVALFEESLLRGYLLWTLSRGIGFWGAAVLLSVLFGAVHGRNPGESPIGLFAAGLIGLVFCLSIWYTGSLWWAIGFHAAWDWGETYFYGTPNSGVVAQGHLLTARPLGDLLSSGGPTGPEGSWMILPIVVLIAAIVYATLRRNAVRGAWSFRNNGNGSQSA